MPAALAGHDRPVQKKYFPAGKDSSACTTVGGKGQYTAVPVFAVVEEEFSVGDAVALQGHRILNAKSAVAQQHQQARKRRALTCATFGGWC